MVARARSVKRLVALCCWWMAATSAMIASADVVSDRDEFRQFYRERFPEVMPDDFVYGVYAIDAELKLQWEAVNEFPPYEFALDDGKRLVEERFDSGESLLGCLGPKPVGRHPYFDAASGKIVTLGSAVNHCRVSHGAEKLSFQRQALQSVIAYLSHLEHGTRRAMALPANPQARAAYQRGKAFFYTKRGQLNLSCADCHLQAVGKHLREQTLMPLVGAVNHFPIYSLGAGALGSLHQRFVGCIEQVRGESPMLESRAFRELEYFLALMADELPIIAPMTQR